MNGLLHEEVLHNIQRKNTIANLAERNKSVVNPLALQLYSYPQLAMPVPVQCVGFQSQRTLFSQLRENRTKIAAVGSGCSLATEPTAEISHFWNIPQVYGDFHIYDMLS